MRVMALLAQPKSHEWETPPDLFRRLDEEFHFDLDAAASTANALCERYCTSALDGLVVDWSSGLEGAVFCNPPYGREIGRWVQKGFEESRKGCTVVMLIPARTETSYWHDYVMRAREIRFIRGRLRFSGSSVNAPFPSAVVVFRPGWFGMPEVSAMDAAR